MKNKVLVFIVLSIFGAIGLGCNISDRISKAVEGEKPAASKSDGNSAAPKEKSIEDTAIDAATDETTGIPECDEVFKMLNEQTSSQDDDFITKAAKGFIFGQIKKGLKDSIEKNQGDKAQIASGCKEAKKEVLKALQEQNAK